MRPRAADAASKGIFRRSPRFAPPWEAVSAKARSIRGASSNASRPSTPAPRRPSASAGAGGPPSPGITGCPASPQCSFRWGSSVLFNNIVNNMMEWHAKHRLIHPCVNQPLVAYKSTLNFKYTPPTVQLRIFNTSSLQQHYCSITPAPGAY